MEDPTQILKVTLHTNAGEAVETFIDGPVGEEPDEIAAGFANELAGRPRWMNIGHLTLFSGAITVIEVDIHAEAA